MQRLHYLQQISTAFEVHPIVALIGPRQVGKTTLAKAYALTQHVPMETHYFDLESQQDLLSLQEPESVLSLLEGLIVIDEVQLLPALFPALRVLVDRFGSRQRYLLLGSASSTLISSSSETLAGRIQFIECFPFSYAEVGHHLRLWLRGGFPKAYLPADDAHGFMWLEAYIRTFLERDIPALGMRLGGVAIRKFWMLLGHYHGQELNYSDLGHALALSHTTLKRYIDLLSSTLIIRPLQPWHENIAKRQVKTPKLYFRDSGIFHQLLGIGSLSQLAHSPKLGASFEGYVIEEIIKHYQARPESVFFWKIHSGPELDLLLLHQGRRIGFEIKHTDSPTLTRSLVTAQQLLALDETFLVYNGTRTFPLTPTITAIGIEALLGREPA